MEDFAGKVAWVTGGTRGLGLAIARALAVNGATVAISGRDSERTATVAAELGRGALAVPLDVADPDQTEAVVERVLGAFGRIDLAVASAGISPVLTRAEHLTVDDWRRIIDVNLSGAFFTLRAAARPMLEVRAGSLVAISSALGRVGAPGLAAYCASKGGIEQVVRTLALEWADRGVRVNAVGPGYVETDMTGGVLRSPHLYAGVVAMTPLGRMARPEEVVGAVLYLLSDAVSFMTGTSIARDGGWTAR